MELVTTRRAPGANPIFKTKLATINLYADNFA